MMNDASRRWAMRLGGLLLALLLAGTVGVVAAHPLGNFTASRYSRLEVGAEHLRVRYVLDLAEVPAFLEWTRIDADGDGALDAAETSRYAHAKAQDLLAGLHLSINGAPTALTLDRAEVTFPPGQGGLNTQRLEVDLVAPLPPGETVRLAYRDDNEPERLGWREVVAVAGLGRVLDASSVPATDQTDGLRAYPEDLLTSPLDVRAATITAAPGLGAASGAAGARAATARARDAFSDLIAT
jgi:nickel/cobalt transporter (NicO) family protein